jgi:hypothetical protein
MFMMAKDLLDCQFSGLPAASGAYLAHFATCAPLELGGSQVAGSDARDGPDVMHMGCAPQPVLRLCSHIFLKTQFV